MWLKKTAPIRVLRSETCSLENQKLGEAKMFRRAKGVKVLDCGHWLGITTSDLFCIPVAGDLSWL